MRYSGDRDDVCAITFAPVSELDRPVGFDTAHAFECESIVEWITKRRNTNPMTGQTVPNAAVASLLHPLIVDENAEHVVETQIILNRAGWVVVSERDKIFRAMTVLRVHMIIYSILTYMLALRLKNVPSDSYIMAGSVFTIAVSFVQLMHQTCQVYPVHGKLIVSHCCVIGAISIIMIEALGLCAPGTLMITKLFVLHMMMLAARLMFDTTKACGMDLQ
jgi:hypothetical protein